MTLKYFLELLQLQYTHIVVRRKHGRNFDYVGGGFADDVSHRFGWMEIEMATVQDNMFVIYVK